MKKTLFATLLSSSLFFAPVSAFADIEVPHMEVNGSAEVEAVPDMADISIAVSLTRSSAKEAKNASDEAIASLLERLNKMGIERQDIKSANISLRAEYSYPKNSDPKLRGYNASRNVSVTIRDLNQLNSVLDGALSDGLNKINGINLRSSQEAELQQQARSQAIGDAINKAKLIAGEFNQTISGVWKIRYNNYSPRPMMKGMAAESLSRVDMSYVDSKISIRDDVDVIFMLNNDEVIHKPTQ